MKSLEGCRDVVMYECRPAGGSEKKFPPAEYRNTFPLPSGSNHADNQSDTTAIAKTPVVYGNDFRLRSTLRK